MVAHAAGQDARPIAARVHAVVRGHGTGRVGHGQLHAVLLPDVAPRPPVLPERRAAGGRGVLGARVPGLPVAAVAVAAQPQLRDRLHTGGTVQRAGDVRAVADVPEHRARPRAQRHRRRRGVRHIRAVRHARLPGRQHVVLLPVPAARQPRRSRCRRVRRVNRGRVPERTVRLRARSRTPCTTRHLAVRTVMERHGHPEHVDQSGKRSFLSNNRFNVSYSMLRVLNFLIFIYFLMLTKSPIAKECSKNLPSRRLINKFTMNFHRSRTVINNLLHHFSFNLHLNSTKTYKYRIAIIYVQRIAQIFLRSILTCYHQTFLGKKQQCDQNHNVTHKMYPLDLVCEKMSAATTESININVRANRVPGCWCDGVGSSIVKL